MDFNETAAYLLFVGLLFMLNLPAVIKTKHYLTARKQRQQRQKPSVSTAANESVAVPAYDPKEGLRCASCERDPNHHLRAPAPRPQDNQHPLEGGPSEIRHLRKPAPPQREEKKPLWRRAPARKFYS